MRSIDTKQIALAVSLILVLCLAVPAQKRRSKLLLTDEDRRAIVSAVFADGFAELNARIGDSSTLDSCDDLILRDEKVAFISTKIIESRFVPKLAGVHFEFMSASEIDDAVKANDKHCYFEFARFEVVGSKVAVMFGKYLRRPGYVFGEAFRYEYTKVAGKWKGKYIGKTTVES